MTQKNKKQVDELVAMLDHLMQQGGGHVNVTVEEDDASMRVETTKSTDCSNGEMACAQPTEYFEEEQSSEEIE